MTRLNFTTKRGQFQGISDGDLIRIRGIRYAISERYGYPKPYTYPQGTVICDRPAPLAPQNQSVGETYLVGEDYLNKPSVRFDEFTQYLSIHRPKTESDKPRPVMVWIRGGSYTNGGIDLPFYDPTCLVNEQDVIVVSIAYRLGVFGYLRDKEGKLANLGLLDQIEALKWIKENIAAFGGDPEQITIFGESAGGSSVEHLLISEGTEGLFQRAIIQSSPMGTMVHREELAQTMLADFLKISVDAPVTELLLEQKRLLKEVKAKGLSRFMKFAPHYGVYPLPAQADLTAAWQNVSQRVAVMVGSNSREVSADFGQRQTLRRLWHFPLTKPFLEGSISFLSRKIFNEGSQQLAKRLANQGQPVYHYSLNWGQGDDFIGACHTADIALLFGLRELPNSPLHMGYDAEQLLKDGRSIRQIWADFAKGKNLSDQSVSDFFTLTQY